MGDLCVKAGKRVYAMIRDGGFTMDQIATYVGPGVGPRWLVANGFDVTLLKEKILGRQRPVLLAGSSAGALRFAAWVQPEAAMCYQQLIERYIAMTFDRGTTPDTVRAAITDVINSYIDDDAISFALSHAPYRLAITTARSRHLAASDIDWVQRMGLLLCFFCNAVNTAWMSLCFERVVFYNSPIPPRFCLREDFRGTAVSLNDINFKHVLAASAAIPLVMRGIRDIFGAPRGVYRDGGMVDYHMNQRYGENGDEATLLFHHQERIVPVWMDKRLKHRGLRSSDLENVLMVYPSEELIRKMPGEKVPDREDFSLFVDSPATRKARWWRAVELSSHLGEEFLELVQSGRIRKCIQEL